MADMPEPMNIFEKFAKTREVKPPVLSKAVKKRRTIGNPAVIAQAQAVYEMEPQGGMGQPGQPGTVAAMGTGGPWGKPS